MAWGDDVDALLADTAPKPASKPAAPAAPTLPDPRRLPRFGAPPAATPDRVAPGGVADVVAGRPVVSGGESLARGGLQGLTSGWSDELAGRIDHGVSHIPGVRDLADHFRAPGAPPLNDPNVSYEDRRDFYRGLNANAQAQHPKTYLGGELLGGVAQAAIPGAKALGALEGGAVAGAGYSNADNADDVAGDALKGAAIGGLGAAAGKLAGAGAKKLIAAAPAVADRAIEKTLGAMSRAKGSARLWAQRGRVMEAVRAEPELRAAINAGKPGKILATVDSKLPAETEAADKIYAAADEAAQKGAASEARTAAETAASRKADKIAEKAQKARERAKKGGVPVEAIDEIAAAEGAGQVGDADVLAAVPIKEPKHVYGGIAPDEIAGALAKVRDGIVGASKDSTQARAIDRAIEDFQGGLGVRYARVPAAKLREWLSERLGPTRPVDRDSSESEKAIADAYDAVHGLLNNYVERNLGGAAAKQLQKANDRITAYSVLRDVAEGAVKRDEQRGGVETALSQVARNVPNTRGEAVGQFLGGYRGLQMVRAAKAVGTAATRAAATPAGQAAGRAAPAMAASAARALSQSTIDALVSGDEKARREAVHREVFAR